MSTFRYSGSSDTKQKHESAFPEVSYAVRDDGSLAG